MKRKILKAFLQWLLTFLYKVEVRGMENFHNAGDRVLIIANHSSLLDPLLLGVFLPEEVTFAINTHIAQKAWLKPFLHLAKLFVMDPNNPLSSKALIRHLEQDKKAVIFPEGRITVTGALMKIYDGTGMVADHSKAGVLPIRIEGAQYTPFSHLRGRVRLRWFPKITINILPATVVSPPAHLQSRERRKMAGQMLADVMTEMMFATSDYHRTLFSAVLDARKIHGGRHIVLEDMAREPTHFNRLITASFCLGNKLKRMTTRGENVGVLMPNSSRTVMLMLGLQAFGRVPAMLNYSVGIRNMLLACQTAQLKRVVTSRRFVDAANLQEAVERIGEETEVVYLEDLARSVTTADKTIAAAQSLTTRVWYKYVSVKPTDPAVVLFTSGSEGTPKGVVLSHQNLLANREQIAAKIDFTSQDIILNALPMFHAFGLTAGTLLPLISGMRTFLYVSPLHYRVVPEVAYEINATVLFGTNTFLAGYARQAHPYDFYSIRYVFAGAEKLQEKTRRTWASKFGIRILEGYGATETSPILTINTPMYYREGTVGQFLPHIDHRLERVPGIHSGSRLHVSGPNIMLGYLLHKEPGRLVPPSSKYGDGWYDTGDIVHIDDDRFVTICGRAKRFAKIGGEMVSLAIAEELASGKWPDAQHAVIALPDPKKGEQLILVSDCPNASRADLLELANDIGEINLPKKVIITKTVPLLASGKIDYPAVQSLAELELKG